MSLGQVAKSQWDRVAAAVLTLVGLGAILLAWLGISRSGFPAEQLPYVVSGGVLGIALIAIGSTLWLSADLRDEWRALDRVDRRIQMSLEGIRSAEEGPVGQEPAVDNGLSSNLTTVRTRSGATRDQDS